MARWGTYWRNEPAGTRVTSFKQPTAEELKHDFLWRVHPHAPAKGGLRSSTARTMRTYWWCGSTNWCRKRFGPTLHGHQRLREALYRQNNTHILKFFLHISPEEQLERFRQRLIDPARNWKISEDDYREREYWDEYRKAYEDVFAKTSSRHAPGTSSPRITSGFATWRSRRSWPRPWRIWECSCPSRKWTWR